MDASSVNRVKIVNESPPQDLTKLNGFYDDWSPKYDTDVGAIDYNGPNLMAQYLHKHAEKLNLGQECEILDVGAGTGLGGQELRKLGYVNLDGLDPSEHMLEQARQKAVYRKHILAAAGNGAPQMPVQDETYDAVANCGSIHHTDEQGLADMVRIMKKGCLLVISTRVNVLDRSAAWLMPALYDMENNGILKKEELDIPQQIYQNNTTALILVYTKLPQLPKGQF